MDISFDCNKCGKHLVIDETGAGITIDCPGCGKPVYVPSPTSQNSSEPPSRVEVVSATPKSPPVLTHKASSSTGQRRTVWSLPPLVTKYGTLRTIATFCQIVAVPVAIVYVLLAFLVFRFEASVLGPVAIIPAVLIVVVGVFHMVTLLAAAESIRVFIDIEENTRATRQMMEYEMVNKYRTTPPTERSVSAGAPPTNQWPQSASHVRFGGTTSR